MSESQQQQAVVDYCALKAIPVFHIPNEGRRSTRNGARLKAEGLKPGVPDLCIPVPRGGYHGLFIEMKDVNGRAPSHAQMEWLELLNANGYAAYWAKGADAAIRLIERYLSA